MATDTLNPSTLEPELRRYVEGAMAWEQRQLHLPLRAISNDAISASLDQPLRDFEAHVLGRSDDPLPLLAVLTRRIGGFRPVTARGPTAVLGWRAFCALVSQGPADHIHLARMSS